MLDRINALREAASQHGHDDLVQDIEPIRNEEGQKNNDRELIIDFMSHMLKTQRLLAGVEASNEKLKDMADKQMYEDRRHQEIKKAQLDTIIRETRDDVSRI